MVFFIIVFAHGGCYKMYDVNQNSLIFRFLQLHMYMYMGWMDIYLIVLVYFFLESNGKSILIDIIHFYNTPPVQTE